VESEFRVEFTFHLVFGMTAKTIEPFQIGT